MIGCRECLSAASTASLHEMQLPSEIGAHCTTCPDCARVITEVRDRETRIATALNQLQMTVDPRALVDEVMVNSRRRTARFWRIGLFAAFVTIASVGVANWLIPKYEHAVPVMFGGGMVTETINLNCISPDQAAALAAPLLRSGQPAVYTVPRISAVVVRGVPPEFAAAKTAIEEFDVKCQLPARPSAAPPATHLPR